MQKELYQFYFELLPLIMLYKVVLTSEYRMWLYDHPNKSICVVLSPLKLFPFAIFPQSLRKVELSSTSRNGCGNGKNAGKFLLCPQSAIRSDTTRTFWDTYSDCQMINWSRCFPCMIQPMAKHTQAANIPHTLITNTFGRINFRTKN